jgi:putative transposase
MLIYEYKLDGSKAQYTAIDEAIRICQFIRNKCLRLWMDDHANKNDLQKYCAVLAKEYPFANNLNSQARQASADRAWSAIQRFYDNCKAKKPGKKGYPRFQKDNRSVEYKVTGWKLEPDGRHITFTDGCGIGRLRLVGTRDIETFPIAQIKRVRIVRRADGYYAQVRRFGAHKIAPKEQEVESKSLLGHPTYLERKLKGESSMLGKRISLKICKMTFRKSCTHGEAYTG